MAQRIEMDGGSGYHGSSLLRGGRLCPPPVRGRSLPHQQVARWPDLEQRRKRLRLAGFDYSDPNDVFFVTVSARHLHQPFMEDALARQITQSLLFLSQAGDWRLYCYCL